MTLPGYGNVKPRELHGKELRDWYAARDECRAEFDRVMGRSK